MKINVLMILIVLSTLTLCGKEYGSAKVDEITSIYDGDTFRANIDSYPSIVGEKMGIRVGNIDTPELKGKCNKEKQLARKAKEFTVNFLRSCKDDIYLKNMQRGKYFRIVADVYCGKESLAEQLSINSLGVKYNGAKKTKDWCN